MRRFDIVTKGWDHYELVDSGEGRKLERFGDYVVDRPDTQSLWHKSLPHSWIEADAQFLWADKGERWKHSKTIPESWVISWKEMKLELSFKGFKHVGVFPEHVEQWKEIREIKNIENCRMLNLFGYTGAASIVAAQAGAKVTHVDASKQTIEIVKKNMEMSGIPRGLRTVAEDALKYAKRLVERGEVFEIIIMDPPAFGRGPKGEVWKIEEKLPELLLLIPELLSPDAQLVVLNGYAAGFVARTFGELLAEAVTQREGEITYGDISIQEKHTGRVLTTSIYSTWRPS